VPLGVGPGLEPDALAAASDLRCSTKTVITLRPPLGAGSDLELKMLRAWYWLGAGSTAWVSLGAGRHPGVDVASGDLPGLVVGAVLGRPRGVMASLGMGSIPFWPLGPAFDPGFRVTCRDVPGLEVGTVPLKLLYPMFEAGFAGCGHLFHICSTSIGLGLVTFSECNDCSGSGCKSCSCTDSTPKFYPL
jgi:hypothetical protein